MFCRSVSAAFAEAGESGWQTMTESTTIIDGTGAVRPVPVGERWFANDLYSACLRTVRRRCETCNGSGMVTEEVSLDEDRRLCVQPLERKAPTGSSWGRPSA